MCLSTIPQCMYLRSSIVHVRVEGVARNAFDMEQNWHCSAIYLDRYSLNKTSESQNMM